MHCLTVKTEMATYEIHMLNPGEVFPRFGGAGGGLVVKKTASLILRTTGTKTGTVTDTEYDIFDRDVWRWIARRINDTGGEAEASSPDV